MATSTQKSKKQLRVEAIQRAKKSMLADKEKVQQFRARHSNGIASGTVGEHFDSNCLRTIKAEKKRARQAAIKRAQEWGAEDLKGLLKKRAQVKSAPMAKEVYHRTVVLEGKEDNDVAVTTKSSILLPILVILVMWFWF